MEKITNYSLEEIMKDLEDIRTVVDTTGQMVNEVDLIVKDLQKSLGSIFDRPHDDWLDDTNSCLMKIERACELIRDTKEMLKSVK